MLVIASIPLVVCLLGLLLWAYKSKPAPIGAELGHDCFKIGLLVFLFVVAWHTVFKLSL